MVNKPVMALLAGVFALYASLSASSEAMAQGKGENRPAAPSRSGPSGAEGRGTTAPSPQQPPTEDEAQSESEELPGAQGACPDRGRKLELIV
ncbi:MAG: hypothetical protein F9K29_08395 [Hyphomicrobiaceae bacterium]|nr:MAG: hypothetical protein F9K29_08395 [Hyphomicrobiaceae bacterium]